VTSPVRDARPLPPAWRLRTITLGRYPPATSRSYRLASAISAAGTVPLDANSASFFRQAGIDAQTTPAAAAAALYSSGDQMLQAVIFHSDHLELSEQFDAWTGYEKSVSDLSWSYAAFLSALRAKNAI
jgi:glucoamylase